jgi:transcriptional regulator with XRE-family HTH domain
VPSKEKKTAEFLSARLVFAANPREARMKIGLSQEDLADQAEVHRTYVSQVERGVTNPSIDSMEKLAKALNKPLFELLVPSPIHDRAVSRGMRNKRDTK